MKKIVILLFILSILLSGCGKQNDEVLSNIDKKQIEEKLNEKVELVNIDEKVNKLKQELIKIGYTGEKLENILKKQETGYKIISNLKGDKRKKYIFENMVLPDLVKDNITPSFCKTNNINLYAKCMYKKGIKLEDIEKKLPSGLRNYFKEIYYYQKYTTKRLNLLQKTSDPIAIQAKKDVLIKIYNSGLLKEKDCSKLPEKNVSSYCKSLFKED